MFDMEDSDSSIDDETLAWIDQYPELELDAPTFNYLRGGAVASVPTCITQEDDVAEHAKDTLSKILRMCSREEVESIGNVNDAKTLISHKQLILEQAETLGREQEEGRRTSKRNRTQRYMARHWGNMPEQQRAQALEANRLGHATARANMSPAQHAQALEADRLGVATHRANMFTPQPGQTYQNNNVHKPLHLTG